MGKWETGTMSTKKRHGGSTELEARASSGLLTLSHLQQTHTDGRNHNDKWKSDNLKKSSKNLVKCPLCTGALPVLSSISFSDMSWFVAPQKLDFLNSNTCFCSRLYSIIKCDIWKDLTMGQWEIWAMSTKKRYGGNTELEARASQGLWTLSHLPQTHADGRNDKWQMKVRQLKRKSSKKFGKVATVYQCSPSVVVRFL